MLRACAVLIASVASLAAWAGSPPPVDLASEGCVDCTSCAGGQHQTNDTAPELEYSDSHSGVHGCMSSTCIVHGVCGGFANAEQSQILGQRLQAVQVAIAEGNVRALEDLLDDQRRVRFVPERGAIQLIGCGGAVVAHFKLPNAQVAALAD